MALKLDTRRIKAGRDAIVIDPHARKTGIPAVHAASIQPSNSYQDDWARIPNQYFFRQPVKRLSAICALQVLRGLTTLDQRSLFRTRDFTDYMNEVYPLVQWDATSTGRLIPASTRTLAAVTLSTMVALAASAGRMLRRLSA